MEKKKPKSLFLNVVSIQIHLPSWIKTFWSHTQTSISTYLSICNVFFCRAKASVLVLHGKQVSAYDHRLILCINFFLILVFFSVYMCLNHVRGGQRRAFGSWLSASPMASKDGTRVVSLACQVLLLPWAILPAPPSISHYKRMYDIHSDTEKKWGQPYRKHSSLLGMLSRLCGTNLMRLKFLSGIYILNVKNLRYPHFLQREPSLWLINHQKAVGYRPLSKQK